MLKRFKGMDDMEFTKLTMGAGVLISAVYVAGYFIRAIKK